jgi:serine/threonine protein kinase
MSTRKLTCPRGHSWEQSGDGPFPADLTALCPFCTASDHTRTHTPPAEQPKDPVVALRPGEVLASFEVLEEINRGGMGIVYKARQQGLNRLVALKVIAPDRLTNPAALNRFRREVQAAALLSHPNIVTVFQTDLDGPLPYLAMEYVSGIDLFSLVKLRGPLSVEDACSYILQAAHGLEHAFERGLVHRDIKPHNLMVTPSPLDTSSTSTLTRFPRIKILDMGLARVVTKKEHGEGSGGLTQTGEFLGTPDFIAPEQAEDPHKADIRSDLYSLGGTLYFLLVGEVPFPTGNRMQKLFRQLTQAPPSALKRRPEVPANVDALIQRLMARDPAERFQTPAEVIDAFEALLRNPSAAPPVAAPAVAPSTLPRASGGPLGQSVQVKQVHGHTGGTVTLCLSADGCHLISGGADETIRLWEAGFLREVRTISDNVGPVVDVSLAPGARWAASCSMRLFLHDMVVQLWDLANGQQRRRLKGHTATVRCVAVAPDGKRVAAGGADHTVRIWALEQPTAAALCLKGHTGLVTSMAFLRGEALLSGSHDGTVCLWDLKTGAVKGTVKGQVGKIADVAFAEATKRIAIAGDTLRVRQRDGSFTQLNGHDGPVLSVAFAADGQRLVSGGSDGTVRVWSTNDGEEVRCLQGHSDKVEAVVVSADGQTIFSGCADGTIRRWVLSS